MGTINLIPPEGGAPREVDEADAPAFIAAQWRVESPSEGAARTAQAQLTEDYSGIGDKIQAAGGQALNLATLGGSDVLGRLAGGEGWAAEQRLVREVNPGATAVGSVLGLAPSLLEGGAGLAGTVSRVTPAGAASRLGSFLSRAAPEASLATKAGRGFAGAAAEGVLQETGSIASDLALADSPEEMDHILGSIGSRYVTTGGISALGGAAFGTLEHTLGATRKRLASAAKDAEGVAEDVAAIPDDIAAIPDRAGVKAAREAEIDRLKAERAVQRAPFIEDVVAFREQTKIDQPWVAVATGGTKAEKVAARKLARGTAKAADEAEQVAVAAEKQAAEVAAQEAKANAAAAALGVKAEPSAARLAAQKGAEEARAAAKAARDAADDAAAKYELAASNMKVPRWMAERGKTYIEADKHIDRLLRNTEGLAEATTAGESARRSLRAALQEQRQALTEIQDRASDLAILHATDSTGRRAAALQNVPKTIEANKALQARIDALGAPLESPRLSALEAHDLNLGTPKPPATLAQKLKAGAVGAAAYGLANVALPGFAHFAAAPLAAAAGARVLGEKLGPALQKTAAASRARQLKAVDAFMTGARVARKVTPPLATQVLSAVRFAPEDEPRRGEPPRKKALTLADHFDARSSEIARLVVPGPNGKPMVPMQVRQQIAANLRPLAVVAPHVADKAESFAVKRLEFIADKAPKYTQIGMTRIPPSEMQIRSWARTIAAAEDPGGVEERLADGTVTREDREVMKALYPDRMAEIVRMTVERLGQLRGTLPYQKRLALSIFTGVPVDASTDPRILAQLQSTYTNEPDTEGGTRAPMPRPAFGSVKKPEPTPAQSRAG